MGEIITEWIAKRTGTILDLKEKNLVEYIKDGKLLAQLIHSYGIIDNETYDSIEPSEQSKQAAENLSRVKLWLKSINIDFEDRLINKLVYESNNSSAIKLLYQLYLALNDKDKLHFIVQKFSKKVTPPSSRFTVEKVEEYPDVEVKEEICEEFLRQQDVIEWQRFKYKNMLERFKEAREKYLLHLKNLADKEHLAIIPTTVTLPEKKNQLKEIKKLPIEPPKDTTYEELVEEQVHFQEIPPALIDCRQSKLFVNKIRQKRRHRERQKTLQVQMQKLLLQELWERIISEQEKEINESLRSVLTQQAKYERQMAMKMMDVREEKKQIVENKKKAQRKVQERVESEITYSGFLEEKQSDDLIRSYYEEKARMLELHRRLYAVRQCLKKQRNWEFCKEIVRDLTDIAFRCCQYKEQHETEIPKELKDDLFRLFVKEQPIFDLLEQVDDVLQDYFTEEPSEVINTYETIRMGYLDEKDFENYHILKWPWELSFLYDDYDDYVEIFEEKLEKIELGMNVLGHIVHWLSESLTSPPRNKKPPDIVKARPAACIVDMPKPETVLPTLKRLLHQNDIIVIEIQEAIDYCLQAYKEESTDDAATTEKLADETEGGLEQKAGTLVKDKKKGEKSKASNAKKDKKKGPAVPQLVPQTPSQPAVATKALQTPKVYPCQQFQFSRKAELGLMAHEILSLGDPIPDRIIADMIVEYLLTLKNIKGWVIVNYPIDFNEATCLEEALTATPIPLKNTKDPSEQSDELSDFANIENRIPACASILKEWKSRIVPKPNGPIEEIFYETFLTAFIKMIPFKQEEEENKQLEFDPEDPFEEKKMSNIEAFYAKQGCYYTMTFKSLDFITIKHLGRLIVGDFTIPPKKSVEIFGDTVLYIEQELKQTEKPGKGAKAEKKGKKEQKPKKVEKKPPPKEEKGKKGDDKKKGADKKGKKGPDAVITAVAMEDKEIQVPEIEPDVIVIFEEPPPPPKPGEFEWCYVTIEFPHKFKAALATLWTTAEEIYVDDFQQLFFFQRMILNAVWPYFTFLRNNLRTFLIRPDMRQIYLYKFQQMFNEFDQDMREDDEVKAELHCRIAEFREKLLEISDIRMIEAEEERRKMMTNYWEGMEACELGNVYINFMQLEMDRCADTLFLVSDYYTGVITKMPFEDPFPTKEILEKIETGDIETPSEIVCALYDFILKDFNVEQQTTELTNPIFDFLERSMISASGHVNKYAAYAVSAFSKLSGFLKRGKGSEKGKGKGSEKSKGGGKGSEKGKGGKGGGAVGGKLPKFTEPDEEVKDAGERILEEWPAVIDAEMTRVNFRLELILMAAKKKIGAYLNNSTDFFDGLYDEIVQKYNNEVDGIEKACEFFARAVEAEMPIQPLMQFRGDTFYIDPYSLLFPDPLPEPEPPLVEKHFAAVFKITELNILVDIFYDVAPDGTMPERTFLYIIQDAICLNAEDGKKPLVPPYWKKLKPQQVEQMVQEMFGKTEFINWKDFVVLSMDVPFPTETELMDLRAEFRSHDPDATETVKDYQFNDITFWFEQDTDPDDKEMQLRLALVKDLLFRLYKINDDTLNYTAMLLAFCKDLNPAVGIAKALALSLGKLVCWDKQTGNDFIADWERKRQETEEMYMRQQMERDVATKVAESVLDQMIDDTVHMCDSVVIEEIVSMEQEVSEYDQELAEMDKQEEEQEEEECSLPPCGSIFSREFSNIEIGYESFDLPPLAYLLPFELLLTVLTAALPWYAKVQNMGHESLKQKIEVIYESLRREEFNYSVLTHEFLNSDDFFKMLPFIAKQFTALRTENIVETLLSD